MNFRRAFLRQRGIAIIMVLLIVALATTMAVVIVQQQDLFQRQVQAQFDRMQARKLSMAGVEWARAVLADDARTNNTDHAGEMWTLRLPAMPVDNGEVIGVIEDRQGLFNLNNLVRSGIGSDADIMQFERLLSLLNLPTGLAQSLADWMDADSEMRNPNGAEDVYYLALDKPYRTANRSLVELNELALVKGFDAAIIERLRPFVSALPSQTTVNVNFASAEVLAAVAEKLSLSDARMVVQNRRGKSYQDLDDFRLRLPRGAQFSDTYISVSSQYFAVTGRAKVGSAQVTAEALLQRFNPWASVVWQRTQ